ncbi:MAG: hypothetical protein O7D91_03665 [Planctomycetota bacterium]|nr:hypothetical protein [Planctomycetota bacterium]
MLLWELVSPTPPTESVSPGGEPAAAPQYRRLPYDTRCAAKTKKGRRCRAKIRPGTDHCPFHDPAVTDERRRRNAAKGGRSRNQLAHLPDGYLRKLKTRADVGHCMDRLYREVRLGIISKEMGTVLFNILCRLLDSGLAKQPSPKPISKGRTKVDRIRPKLNDLLTSKERTAWNQAIADASANAPEHQSKPRHGQDLDEQADDAPPLATRPIDQNSPTPAPATT